MFAFTTRLTILKRVVLREEARGAEERRGRTAQEVLCAAAEAREKRREARREEREARSAAEKKAIANDEKKNVRPQQQEKRDARSGRREKHAARESRVQREKRERRERREPCAQVKCARRRLYIEARRRPSWL